MRLPFFRAKDPAGPAEKPRRGKASQAVDEGPVQAARVQARRRLIGALVLLAAGVIGFPILFETQPRPLPVDTPFLVNDRATAPVTSVPTSRPRLALPPDAGTEAGSAMAPALPDPVSPVAVVASAPAVVAPPARVPSAAAQAPEKAVPAAVAPATASATQPPTAARTEAPKPSAKAGTEAKPASLPATVATTGRFVVQVGAYNDAERLKAARQKVEKLGFKSYTQDVDTATGKRTRVRLGPFATRQEAEAAAGKVKGAGMQANVLAL